MTGSVLFSTPGKGGFKAETPFYTKARIDRNAGSMNGVCEIS
jgi:hypothetical protein